MMVRRNLFLSLISLGPTACQGFVPSKTKKCNVDGFTVGRDVPSKLGSGFSGSSGGNVGFSTTEEFGGIRNDLPQEAPGSTMPNTNYYQQQAMNFEEFCKYGSDSTNTPNERNTAGGYSMYDSMSQPQQISDQQNPFSYSGTVYASSQQPQQQQQQPASFEDFCRSGSRPTESFPQQFDQQSSIMASSQTQQPGSFGDSSFARSDDQSINTDGAFSSESDLQREGIEDTSVSDKDFFFAVPDLFFVDNFDSGNTMRVGSFVREARQELGHNPTIPITEDSDDQYDEDRFLKMVSSEISVKQLIGQNPYAINDLPVDVMVGRFLDVVEDTVQKKNGKFRGEAKLKGKSSPSPNRPTVVILGTGWAAHAFIKCASTYDLRIVVVSPINHFVSLFSRFLFFTRFFYLILLIFMHVLIQTCTLLDPHFAGVHPYVGFCSCRYDRVSQHD